MPLLVITFSPVFLLRTSMILLHERRNSGSSSPLSALQAVLLPETAPNRQIVLNMGCEAQVGLMQGVTSILAAPRTLQEAISLHKIVLCLEWLVTGTA